MSELATVELSQFPDLPDNIPDLVAWDKYLSARMPVYRKLLKEVNSIEEVTAEEARIQKRASLESEYLIDVRVKIGKLIQEIPKASGKRTDLQPCDNVVDRSTKSEVLAEMGISQKQAERYQKMASHPEAVEKAKADARERNDVVSQQDVLNRIITPPKSKEAEQRKELKAAGKRQEDFKDSKTVSIADVRQNKEDIETIGRDMYGKLSKLVDLADKITFFPKSKELEAMSKVISKRDIANLANGIERTLATLADILEVIG